ncbi:MAG: nucleoside phosphorylase [Sulfolobaceae archaeon]|nr:nucleoside phosphorylase [Sulfolobaceae archaeon]
MSLKPVLQNRPYHILAKPGDIAERVVMGGDAKRIEMTKSFLENPRLVNTNRGYLAYTGKYKGKDVTLIAHGIGGPSIAIVIEELFMLGAKIMIRAGTSGGLRKEVPVGTAFIFEGAAYEMGGTPSAYIPYPTVYPAVATPEIVIELERECKENGVICERGIGASHDAFHMEHITSQKWYYLNIGAVEMECATLFTLARLRGIKAGCITAVLDNMETVQEINEKDREELEKKVVKVALDTIVKF